VIRLFKNLNGIYFDYCVHETVRKTLLKNNKIITELPAVIHHYQELKSFDNIKEKQETYFKLSLNNIKKYPHYAKSYNDVAIYYATYKEENDKALEYCKKAIELAPRKIEYLLNYSYRLRDLKKHEEAILFLKRIKDKYDDERIYRALGYLYYTIKQYHFALEMYEKAIKLNSPIKEQLQKNIETIKKEQLSL